jgi:hypothetical protein
VSREGVWRLLLPYSRLTTASRDASAIVVAYHKPCSVVRLARILL